MFLIITALPFVVVAMVFTFLLNKNREYELYGEKINSLKMEYLSMKQQEQSFLLNYPSDNTFFKTGDNDYLRRFDILSRDLNKHFDEVLNINTTQKLNIGDKIYMLKENAGSYADLLNTIANKAYQRGSVSTGIIGELERSYANAVTQNSLPAKSLAALKDAEVQYLYRKDSKFYNDFIALYSQYMGSAPGGMGKDDVDLTINVGNTSSNDSTESHVVTPIPMVTSQNSDKAKPINDFKRYFTSLVKIDREIGFSSEEGLLAELEVEKGKLDDILIQLSNLIFDMNDYSFASVIRKALCTMKRNEIKYIKCNYIDYIKYENFEMYDIKNENIEMYIHLYDFREMPLFGKYSYEDKLRIMTYYKSIPLFLFIPFLKHSSAIDL